MKRSKPGVQYAMKRLSEQNDIESRSRIVTKWMTPGMPRSHNVNPAVELVKILGVGIIRVALYRQLAHSRLGIGTQHREGTNYLRICPRVQARA